jgi:hypothetical protein
LVDGEPKRYCGRKTLPPLTVDIHSFSLLQLVNHVAETFSWGSKQYVSLWRSLDESVEIRNDEQLLEWCEMNLQHGTVHINAQINDFDGPLQFSPTKHRLHPKVRSILCEPSNTPPMNVSPPHDISQPTYMRVEKRHERVKKTKKKSVDEDSDTESLEVPSDSSYDSDLASSSDSDCSDSDFECNPDSEILDEDEEEDSAFAYDADDPCIDVGVIFPDVDQCKSAVTHHAILNDYGFQTVKKCSKRFRAKCKRADKGCKWMFFASTSKKYIGCKVNVHVLLYVYEVLMCCDIFMKY